MVLSRYGDRVGKAAVADDEVLRASTGPLQVYDFLGMAASLVDVPADGANIFAVAASFGVSWVPLAASESAASSACNR
jgi:hypothetical protein